MNKLKQAFEQQQHFAADPSNAENIHNVRGRPAALHNRVYTLCWDNDYSVQLVGAATVAKALRISPKTLGVYLSSGRAAKGWRTNHPVTGNPATLTIAAAEPNRVDPDILAKGK